MDYREIKFPFGTRFLVTGGAGFIGSNLAQAIAGMGYQVRILDDLSIGREENIKAIQKEYDIEFVKGSINDLDTCKKACKNIDYVLHEAAYGSVPRSMEMPLVYDQNNNHGTLNMMQAAFETGVKKFVYASSSSVYGDSSELPKVEGKEGNLLSPYAITKHINELYAKFYYDHYKLPCIGMRYFNVFGRRQDPHSTYAAVIPIFVKTLLDGNRAVIYGDGSFSRDFTYIDNVIEANLKACIANEEADGEVFNIAYGESNTILELYNKICSLLGIVREPIFAPIRAGDIPHSHANIQKARRLLGYVPAYNLDKGLELTINWYVEYLE